MGKLTALDKLLLYLKLPSGRPNDIDPLRQPLNPLGSRSEIQLTINWIRTHLEEDPQVFHISIINSFVKWGGFYIICSLKLLGLYSLNRTTSGG